MKKLVAFLINLFKPKGRALLEYPTLIKYEAAYLTWDVLYHPIADVLTIGSSRYREVYESRGYIYIGEL